MKAVDTAFVASWGVAPPAQRPVLITTRRALAGRPRQARYVGYHDEGQTCSRLSASLYQRSRKGRFRSGQTGQTVNLLALRLHRFESYPAHQNKKLQVLELFILEAVF